MSGEYLIWLNGERARRLLRGSWPEFLDADLIHRYGQELLAYGRFLDDDKDPITLSFSGVTNGHHRLLAILLVVGDTDEYLVKVKWV